MVCKLVGVVSNKGIQVVLGTAKLLAEARQSAAADAIPPISPVGETIFPRVSRRSARQLVIRCTNQKAFMAHPTPRGLNKFLTPRNTHRQTRTHRHLHT